MQALVLLVNAALNLVLLAIGLSAIHFLKDDGLDAWTVCACSSGLLIVANIVFCIARMIVLWSRGRKQASLWGLVPLAILPLGAHYLWGAYFLGMMILSGAPPIGGD